MPHRWHSFSRVQGRCGLLCALVFGEQLANAAAQSSQVEAYQLRGKATNVVDSSTLPSWEVNTSSFDRDLDRNSSSRASAAARRTTQSTWDVYDGWPWPPNTELSFMSEDETVVGTAEELVSVLAGKRYFQIKIDAPGESFGSDHESPTVKLVYNSIGSNDLRCTDTEWDAPVGIYDIGPPEVYGNMGTRNGPLLLQVENPDTGFSWGDADFSANIMFMHGGNFRLCYTPDGTFSAGDQTEYKNNLVDVIIEVIGVQGDCTEDGCMRTRRWDCAFAYKGEQLPDCLVSFAADGGRVGWSIQPGIRSLMSWSQVWDADTINAQGDVTTHPQECVVTPPEGSEAGDMYLDTTDSGFRITVDAVTSAVLPPVKAPVKDGFTVTACYCPNYNYQTGAQCTSDDQELCCDDRQEYIQNFGVMYYWTVRICDHDNYATCDPPYMRVVPQQKFVLRVQCPPGGGCLQTNDNLLKFIEYGVANDRPSWDGIQGCKNVDLPADTAVWSNEFGAQGLYGGTSTIFKSWQLNPVKLNLELEQQLDLCYCNSEAEAPNCWFKIGEIRTTKDFAMASRTAPQSNIETIRYVNWPGSVTLFGGITTQTDTVHPRDGNKYSGKALLKIVSFDRELVYGFGASQQTVERFGSYDIRMPTDFMAQMNLECQRQAYSEDLWYSFLDSRRFMAVVDAQSDTTPSSYLSFTGVNQQEQMVVQRAGIVAVCYCGMVTDDDTCFDTDWLFVTRMTIRGPRGEDQWIFPTGIAVTFSVLGWGLSDMDKLRIVPASSTCGARNNNPPGDDSYKVGCPAVDGAGCTRAGELQLLGMQTTSTQSSGIHISEAVVAAEQTELVFTSSVEGVLMPGDLFTIDPNTILINGNGPGDQTDIERYHSAKLSGIQQFADDPTADYMIGHRAIAVLMPDGTPDWTRMRIPVGWIDDLPNFPLPTIAFASDLGAWSRRSEATTVEAVKASGPAEDLKVCWGVQQGVDTTFYVQAGQLSFRTPPPLHNVRASLTTKQWDAVAPVIISFMTDPMQSDYQQYAGAHTMLLLRFLDISSNAGKIVPHFSGDIPPELADGPPIIPDDSEVPSNLAQQWVCGKLFAELWSNHEDGFPLPDGCFYTRKYRDEPTALEPTTFYREFYITFRENTGLRAGVEYQMVINARALDVSLGDPLVEIFSLCNDEEVCDRAWQGFEKGVATAFIGMCADGPCQRTELKARELVDPNWAAADAFVIERGDAVNSVLNLADLNILQIRLAGGTGQEAITRESHIRISLWPLTAWDVGTDPCTAICEAYRLANARCEGDVGCQPEAAVNGSGWENIIKVRLPFDMDPITGSITHTVRITGLALPPQGWFPSRVGAQLTKDDDTMPIYTTSTYFLMKDPDEGMTTGRLVMEGRTGYGPKPFASDEDNVLYVRLQFGATVWNNGQANSALVVVLLPDLYTCSVAGSGEPEPTIQAFQQNANLSRGVVHVSELDGDWASSIGFECVYKLRADNAFFAGMVAYVKLTVRNPDIVMSKLHPDNVWSVKLSGMGANSNLVDALDMPTVPFITLSQEEGFYGSNAAILNSLTEENIQPSDFSRSTADRLTTERLSVFFRTSTYVGQQGYVILDAPPGFDFGADCGVFDLAPSYYAFLGITEPQLINLKEVVSCTGLPYPPPAPGEMVEAHNRARIHVGGVIDQEAYYGFALRVTHPSRYDPLTQHQEWYLYTQDSNGFGLDGSLGTIHFNLNQAADQTEIYHLAWGMYSMRPDEIGVDQPCCTVEFSETQPYTITEAWSQVTIGPFLFNEATDTSLRVTAPVGFEWDTAMATTFVARPLVADDSFPAIPTVENSNQLVWTQISFSGNTLYYFEANIQIPNNNPVTSSNSFFIEVGFVTDIPAFRLYAAVVTPARVAALTNCEVSYSSNLQGDDNLMEFRFETVTELTTDQGVVIKGDANTRGFVFECPPLTVLEGSAPMPEIFCVFPQTPDNLPALKLKVLDNPLPPGLYMIEVTATNPNTQTLQGTWTFGTYNSVMDHPNIPPATHIDGEQAALGFNVNGPILEARLISEAEGLTETHRIATGRDDRPGRENFLIFRFQLRSAPSTDSELYLRGPRGFQFAEKCVLDIITDSNNIFGPNTLQDFVNLGYSDWPDQATPTNCVGNGRFVTISIPAGLARQNMYAFQIRVVSNPMATPDPNTWTIDFNSETSEPFRSFTVWTFTEVNVNPVSAAKSLVGANVVRIPTPVTLTFRVFNSIPFAVDGVRAGGMLRVIAPQGFEFFEDADTQKCIFDLTETETGYAYTPADMDCTVRQGVRMHLNMVSLQGVTAGREYQLVARVFNPPSTTSASIWQMDSWAGPEANPQDALDEITMPGYDVMNVLNRWSVTNTNNVRTGYSVVTDVELLMAFPDPLQRDDEIVVTGPLNFFFQGDPDLRTCSGFNYPMENPFQNTDPPRCDCGIDRCYMTWTIQENSDPALLENVDIVIRITTANPAQTPPLTDNFWKIDHRRNFQGTGFTTRSLDAYQSWQVLPQLENLEIILSGPLMAASTTAESTTSSLQFRFTAVSTASVMSIMAVEPSGFDFSRAVVQSPISIQSNQGSTIVLERLTMQPGVLTDFTIDSVLLGLDGGQTIWSLVTYADADLQMRLDEKIEFEGFLLPGKVTVVGKEFISQYQQNANQYPVKSLFLPRVDEPAMVEFSVMFSQNVLSRELLVIACSGDYQLQTSPFNIFGTGPIEHTVVRVETRLEARVKPSAPRTEVALMAHTEYLIVFWVIPVTGENLWTIYTTDGGVYNTNTNDGLTVGFSPVEWMIFGVSAPHRPPGAIIDVTLNINQGTAIVRELTIIAPLGFVFPSSGCGDLCSPGQAFGTSNRRTAVIASGDPLLNLNNMVIQVLTPEFTPEDFKWYVEGRGQGIGTTTGWGEAPGFRINQMRGSEINYAGVPNLASGQVVFYFTLDQELGRQLEVQPPAGYVLTCSLEGTLRQLSLPGSRPQCTDDPLVIQLTEVMAPGEYAFALSADLPAETPAINTFNLIVSDLEGNVVDAAYYIPGKPIIPVTSTGDTSQAWVSDPYLAWSSSSAGETSTITIGLSFNGESSVLMAILFTLPPGFTHEVRRPTDVQNHNKDFPLAPSPWADTSEFDRIMLKLDDTEDTVTIFPGDYSWSFPVLVPCCSDADMPKKNVWTLTLCTRRECLSDADRGVLLSFPLAGFNLGEESTFQLTASSNDAKHIHTRSGLAVGLLIAALLDTVLAACFC